MQSLVAPPPVTQRLLLLSLLLLLLLFCCLFEVRNSVLLLLWLPLLLYLANNKNSLKLLERRRIRGAHRREKKTTGPYEEANRLRLRPPGVALCGLPKCTGGIGARACDCASANYSVAPHDAYANQLFLSRKGVCVTVVALKDFPSQIRLPHCPLQKAIDWGRHL